MAYKQQIFFTHSSGGWEVQDQGSARGESPLPAPYTAIFSLCPYVAERVRELPRVSLVRTLIPFIMAPPSGSPKGPTSRYHYTRDYVSMYKTGGTHTFSLQQYLYSYIFYYTGTS